MKEEKKVKKKMQPCMTCGQDKKGEKKREFYNSPPNDEGKKIYFFGKGRRKTWSC